MVTLLKNNFNGQTSGGSITTTNSKTSGDAFYLVMTGTGAAWTYQTSAGVGGTIGAQLAVGSGTSYLRYNASGADGRRVVLRRTFVWGGSTGATANLLDARTDVSESKSLGSIHIRTTGQLQARAGNLTDITASRHAIPSAGTYHLELAVTASSAEAADDGKVEYRLYAADGTSLLHSWSSGYDQPVSYSPPSQVRFSTMSTGGMDGYDRIDNVQALFTDDLTAWVGPYVDSRVLPAPVPTLSSVTIPTTPGSSTGSITVSWPKIVDPDLADYEIHLAPGLDANSGFTMIATVAQPSGATGTYTATGLAAGPYTVAVRAVS